MQFHLPQYEADSTEQAYQSIRKSLVSQFRMPIEERRVFALNYLNSKRRWRAEVGALEQQEHQYQILAIFESKQFIVYTRSKQGFSGPIILVDKAEVTLVEDFE